ncbi:MAG: hypothetical protein AB8C02_04435 [Halioglobus sp.]
MYFWEAGSVIEKLRVLEGVSSLRMDLGAKLLGSILIAVSSTANAISPCPPVPEVPMLSLDNPDWVIAEVTVIGQMSQADQFSEGAARVRVDRVYAGQLNVETLIVEEDRGVFDCTGAFVPNRVEDIGQRFLLGMAGPNANGSYGGLQALSVRRIIFSEIIGGIPGFQTDTANPSTDEFSRFLNTLMPRAETDDYRLSIAPRLPSRSDKPSLKVEGNNGACLDSATANAVVVDHANGVAQVSFSPEYAEVESCDYRVPASIAFPAFERTRNEFYTVSVYEEDVAAGESPFQSDNLVAKIEYAL